MYFYIITRAKKKNKAAWRCYSVSYWKWKEAENTAWECTVRPCILDSALCSWMSKSDSLRNDRKMSWKIGYYFSIVYRSLLLILQIYSTHPRTQVTVQDSGTDCSWMVPWMSRVCVDSLSDPLQIVAQHRTHRRSDHLCMIAYLCKPQQPSTPQQVQVKNKTQAQMKKMKLFLKWNGLCHVVVFWMASRGTRSLPVLTRLFRGALVRPGEAYVDVAKTCWLVARSHAHRM